MATEIVRELVNGEWVTTVGSGGGGSQPDDWISVYKFGGSQPCLTTNTFAAFDTGNDPPPRGTALSWDVGTPTVVNVNEDGTYDISGKILVRLVDDEVPGVVSLAELLLNGDNTGPGYSHDLVGVGVPVPPGINIPLLFFIPGVAQVEGDEIKLICNANDEGTLLITEAVLTIARRS